MACVKKANRGKVRAAGILLKKAGITESQVPSMQHVKSQSKMEVDKIIKLIVKG